MNILDNLWNDVMERRGPFWDKWSEKDFPHGTCECCLEYCKSCHERPGPAAFQVDRAGKTIKVCSCCDLTFDTNKKLLVTKDDNRQLFRDYDGMMRL